MVATSLDDSQETAWHGWWSVVTVSIVVVQLATAAFLGMMKWQAIRQLPPGGVYPVVFYHIMATIDWAGAAVAFGALIISAIMLCLRAQAGPTFEQLIPAIAAQRRTIVAIAGCVMIAGTFFVQHCYPLTMDEYAPVLQSEIFAAGQLWGQWPPELAGGLISPRYGGRMFVLVNTDTGKLCSEYWPGHALLLSPFTAVGATWLLNPLLTAAAIWLIADIARRMGGSRVEGWTVLLVLTSPLIWAYGISFYAMPAHLVANLIVGRLLLSGLPRAALGAGAVSGFALSLHNPLPQAVFVFPWLLWMTMYRRQWPCLLCWILAALVVFVPLDIGWRSVKEAVQAEERPETLEPEEFNQGEQPVQAIDFQLRLREIVLGAARRYGRYLQIFKLPAGGREAFLKLAFNSAKSVSWESPGLLVLGGAGFFVTRRRSVRLWLSSGVLAVVVYYFIDISGGHGWGYRYFFPFWACLPLSAGFVLGRRLISTEWSRLRQWIGMAAVVAGVIGVPLRMFQIEQFVRRHVSQLPVPDDRLVSVDEVADRVIVCVHFTNGWFKDMLIRNDPFLRHGPIMVACEKAENAKEVCHRIAAAGGFQPQLVHGDSRGSVWLLSRPGSDGLIRVQ